MNKLCCLCDIVLHKENDSGEHVILNAIGGRKIVRGVLCKICNGKTGVTWDAELARQLNPLSLFFRVSRQRGIAPRQKFDTSGGGEIAVTAFGLEIAKPNITMTEADGKKIINIQARNEKQARKILEDLRKGAYPRLDVEAALTQRVLPQRDEYLDELVKMQVSIGGLVAGRSIVKSAYILAVASGAPMHSLEEGRRYLLGDDTPCFDYVARLDDFVINRPTDAVFHCAAVQSVNGMLLGYIEYFSIYKILVCLSKRYNGPPINSIIAINPLNGTEPNIEVVLNITLAELEDMFMHPGDEALGLKRAFGAAIELGMRRQLELELPKAVDRAMSKAWEALELQDGQELSPYDRQRFFRLVAENMAPFCIHAARMGFHLFGAVQGESPDEGKS